MQISLLAGAPPAFLSKNYANKDVVKYGGFLQASTGQAFAYRLLDMDPYSYWTSAGSTDAITETIDGQIYEGAGQAARDVDFVGLLNTNVKNFKIEYSTDNGATFTPFTGANHMAGPGIATEDFLVSLAAPVVGVNRWKVSALTVQSGTEKIIGTLVLGLGSFQLSKPFESYSKRAREQVRTIELGDGTLDTTYIKRSAASYEYYEASGMVTNLPQAELRQVEALKRSGAPFLFVPEPGDVQRDVFLSLFSGVLPRSYSALFKGSGYDVAFSVREIGG